MPSLEELQAALADSIAKLDQERQENARRNKEERENMLLEVEIERKKRLEKHQAQVAEHERQQREKEAAAEARRQAEIAERVVSDQKQAALDEALRIQREKLEWLEKAIADAEFTEEQHKKALESQRAVPTLAEESEAVSAEYPQTCANGGAAAAGTDGSTPVNPLMSDHLKNILRQATRSY
jgi:chromosome segregation ATPase